MRRRRNFQVRDSSQLRAPRVVGANNATGKEELSEDSRSANMTVPRKTIVETRVPDAAIRKPSRVFKFASANVGSLVGRSAEVVDMMCRRNVDVAGLQEVRYKNQGTRTIRGGDGVYKLYWSGISTGQGGVGLLIKKELEKQVIEVRRINERVIALDLAIENDVVTILSVYAPQCGLSSEEKDKFYEQLSLEMLNVHGKCVVMGDFNGHVGKKKDGYEGVHGGHGFGHRNSEGERILDFADSFELKVANTWFKKDEEKLITYESGDHRTMIDYVLVGKREKVRNVKTIPGEEIMKQHRLLVMDLMVSTERNVERVYKSRVKTWKLKDTGVQNILKDKARKELNENDSWDKTNEKVMKIMSEVCGRTKMKQRNKKETWWWNNSDVKRALKEKKEKYKLWRKNRNEDTRADYVATRNRAKREVAKAMNKEAVCEVEKIESMRTEERMKYIFRMAKKETESHKDVIGSSCMRSQDGHLKLRLEDRLKIWEEYSEDLLNKENSWENNLESKQNEGPFMEVSGNEVKKAMLKMKFGKAAGPSGVPIEAIQLCSLESSLAKVANQMLKGDKMPESWRKSVLIPLYKGKGDAKDCSNYRSVKLLEHSMKIIERIFVERIRRRVEINEIQLGFMPGKGTIDAIFAVRQLIEKYSLAGKDLYMIFIDLEKAFDRVPRKVIWWALRKKGVIEAEVRVVMEMYREAETAVRLEDELSNWFGVNVGVHQGSVLSPLLFAIVLDALTEDLEKNMREVLYADDLVIIGDDWEDVKTKYEKWKYALESRGLKINVDKTKAMRTTTTRTLKGVSSKVDPCGICGARVMRNSIRCETCHQWIHKRCSGVNGSLLNVTSYECAVCKGDVVLEETEKTVQFGDDVIEVVDEFCYLGDMLCRDGDVRRATTTRIRAGWKKFRELWGVLCGRRLSLKLKGWLYKVCVRSVLCYGAECWAMKVADIKRMQTTEMRMLRMIGGISLRDKVPNSNLREMVNVDDIGEFMRGHRLRWLGHLERMDTDSLTRKVYDQRIDGVTRKGRPRKTWKETVSDDMNRRKLKLHEAQERGKWRRRCRNPVDPDLSG